MTDQPFACIVADPPWSLDDNLPGETRGAAKNYKTMSVDEICGLATMIGQGPNAKKPLALDLAGFPIADDALLFLWRLSSMVEEAYTVVRAWGFEPKSEIVWEKLTTNNLRHFGMGRYVRAAHETCIIARRGRAQVRHRSQRSTFGARVGLHSEKPDGFFHIVENLCWGPYLELFARRQRPGWICWGDEL